MTKLCRESRRLRAQQASVAKNTDVARAVVATRVGAMKARMAAKRLLPEARVAGYGGSARNSWRLVAEAGDRVRYFTAAELVGHRFARVAERHPASLRGWGAIVAAASSVAPPAVCAQHCSSL